MATFKHMAHDWKDLTTLTGGRASRWSGCASSTLASPSRGPSSCPLAQLPMEDQVFIGAFVRSHGSIKEMERLFGVSYPTIKGRLNRLSEALGLGLAIEAAPEAETDWS